MTPSRRVVLVHGSVVGPTLTWAAQRRLAARWDLDPVLRRGFPPGPPAERVDFEDEAEWLLPRLAGGVHLVGHSYGGIVCLLAAARRPDLVRSLAVAEPPCFGVARGQPAVEPVVEALVRLWESGEADPERFLRRFSAIVGLSPPPARLPDWLETGARTLMRERGPWEAEIPFDALAAAPFPKLVVSGAHSAAFDAVCDRLADGLPAELAVLPGAGHGVTRAGGFNEVLETFLTAASG